MASQGTLDVKGFKELERKLRRLDDVAAGRALTDATVDGSKVIRDDMRRRAPRGDRPGGSRGHGHAADHINVEERQRHRTTASVNVGPPRWGWYLVFAEFGVRPHDVRAKSGPLRIGNEGFAARASHPGHPPTPWMRPAFDARKADAVKTMRSSLRRRIRDVSR